MWASERPSWFSTNALTLLLGEKIAAQRGQSFLEGHTAQDPKFPAFYLSLLTAPCYSQENKPTCIHSPPTWISRKGELSDLGCFYCYRYYEALREFKDIFLVM